MSKQASAPVTPRHSVFFNWISQSNLHDDNAFWSQTFFFFFGRGRGREVGGWTARKKASAKWCTRVTAGEIRLAPDDQTPLMGCRTLDIEYRDVQASRPRSLSRVEMETLHFPPLFFFLSTNYIWLAWLKSDSYLFSSLSLVSWGQLSLPFSQRSLHNASNHRLNNAGRIGGWCRVGIMIWSTALFLS